MELNDMNWDQLAEKWHTAHDMRTAMEKALKEDPEYVSYGKDIEQIEAIVAKRLAESGATSVNTSHGTVHTVGKTTARIMDAEAFRLYVTAHERWDMLDWKANMTACRDYLKENREPVPGVELSTYRRVSITSPRTLRRLDHE